MKWMFRAGPLVIPALLSVLLAVAADAGPITGTWVVTNGNDIIAPGTENTNSPALAPIPPDTSVVSNTVQSAFPTITLTDPGDYVEARGTIDLVRTSGLTTANQLNDQLRLGLFSAPAPPTAGASGDPRGFILEYGTGSPVSEVRALIATQANPFSGGAGTPVIGLAGADPEGHTLTGTPVAANFIFRVTRQAGNTVDLTGSVTGITQDPLDNDYLQQFSILGHSPHASFNYDLNRIAFLLGGNAGATEAVFRNVQVRTNVPEPATALVGLAALVAAAFTRQRMR